MNDAGGAEDGGGALEVHAAEDVAGEAGGFDLLNAVTPLAPVAVDGEELLVAMGSEIDREGALVVGADANGKPGVHAGSLETVEAKIRTFS